MLYDAVQAAEEAATLPTPATGLAFDWSAGAYPIDRGSPREVIGVEAVKAWLELVLRTEAGRYGAYPSDFGASLYALLGRRLPKGASLSELRRQLQQSAAYLPVIGSIGPVTWDGTRVTCTVTLEQEGTETTEVMEFEP